MSLDEHKYLGCDAFGSVFNILGAAAAVGAGPTWTSFIMLACVQSTFYLAQWEEYHTGTMSCGNGYFGVTESQMTLMAIHVITSIYGLSTWDIRPFSSCPYNIRELLLVALVLSNIALSLSKYVDKKK